MSWCISCRGQVFGPFVDVFAAWSWFESSDLPGCAFALLVDPDFVDCLAGLFPGPKPSRRSIKIAREVVEKQPGGEEMDSMTWSVIKCGSGGAPEFVLGPFEGFAAAAKWVAANSGLVSSWSSYRIEPICLPEVFDAIRDASRRAQFKLIN